MDEDPSSEESRDVETLAESRSLSERWRRLKLEKKLKDGVRDTLFQVCAASVLGSSTSTCFIEVWSCRFCPGFWDCLILRDESDSDSDSDSK